jgi:phosphoglycerate dehydrogenase-like enzyme/predicted dehydrogenase
MIRLVLVGCGGIAKAAHLPAIAALRAEGLVELVGICDLDVNAAREAAAAHGVSDSDGDWRRLAERTGAQAISLCLPPGPNVRIAVEALDAGLHVLSEKPPARDAAQARRMADAARSHPELVTMIAFNRRHAPLYTRAMERSRELGEPHTFYGRFTRGAMGGEPSNTASDWITSDGSHALDLAVATIGEPTRISVTRRRCSAAADNVWTVQLAGAPGGGGAVLVLDFAAGRRMERFEWSGPAYDAALELPGSAEWSVRGAEVERWTLPAAPDTPDFFTSYGFPDEYRSFVRAIEGGERPRADFEYGWRFMRLVEAILGCESGASVEIASGGAGAPEVRSNGAHGSATHGSGAHLAGATANGNGGSGYTAPPEVHILQAPSSQARFFPADLLSRASGSCNITLRADDDRWRDELPRAEALITGWGGVPLEPEDVQRAERLRFVVVIGASVKSVSPEALIERGVVLCNTADAIAQSVAEHCLMVTLAGLRRLTDVDSQMHRGGWPPRPLSRFSARTVRNQIAALKVMQAIKPIIMPIARPIDARIPKGQSAGWSDLRGQTVGLVGWGNIARHFVALLRPFGCDVIVHTASASEEELARHGVRRAALAEVLSARVVSLHSGLTERTRGMLGARARARLQKGTGLVNTARGPLIDEDALVARLRGGDIVAALDVYDEEPLPRDHALRKLRNAILTPHNASTTAECQRRVGRQALELLLAWAEGEAPAGLDAGRLAAMT